MNTLPPLPDHVEYLPDDQVKFYTDMGYKCIMRINGDIVAIQPFMFTFGILVGMDETGYKHRFCYHSFPEALTGLVGWINEGGEEPQGYIKRKG